MVLSGLKLNSSKKEHHHFNLQTLQCHLSYLTNSLGWAGIINYSKKIYNILLFFLQRNDFVFFCLEFSREGLSDPWEGRLLGGRRINMKGRQRMFSGPNGGSSGSSNGSGDRYAERMRERNISYRPYRIPRPKLLNMGSRLRTISATLHEEPESNRLAPILDSSPVSVTTDALRSMAIGENLGTTLLSKNVIGWNQLCHHHVCILSNY